MKERSEDIERQERIRKVRESRYAEEYREIASLDKKAYLQEGTRKRKKQLELLGRFRLGSETNANKYWLKEEERKYRLCKEDKETLKHIIESAE